MIWVCHVWMRWHTLIEGGALCWNVRLGETAIVFLAVSTGRYVYELLIVVMQSYDPASESSYYTTVLVSLLRYGIYLPVSVVASYPTTESHQSSPFCSRKLPRRPFESYIITGRRDDTSSVPLTNVVRLSILSSERSVLLLGHGTVICY